MTTRKQALERLDRALALADRSNKIDRLRVVGRAVCDNLAAVRGALSVEDGPGFDYRAEISRLVELNDKLRKNERRLIDELFTAQQALAAIGAKP